MAFCSNCGKQIPDNAKFCGYCGAPANPVAQVGAAPRRAANASAPNRRRSGAARILPAALLLLVFVIAGGGFFLYSRSPAVQLRRYMNLGEKYLADGKYEEASYFLGYTNAVNWGTGDRYENRIKYLNFVDADQASIGTYLSGAGTPTGFQEYTTEW